MSWRNALVLAVVLSLIGILGFGLTRSPDGDIPSPLVGEAAPAFELQKLDGGGTLALADLSGRPAILNFWASWCLACIQEHPSLVRAWETYKDSVEMVGVVFQDTPANARRYMKERGGGWTQLLDPGTRTAIDFGVYGVPETFFIDGDGLITHKQIGPVTDEIMTTQIEALLHPERVGNTPDSSGVNRAPGEDSVP